MYERGVEARFAETTSVTALGFPRSAHLEGRLHLLLADLLVLLLLGGRLQALPGKAARRVQGLRQVQLQQRGSRTADFRRIIEGT